MIYFQKGVRKGTHNQRRKLFILHIMGVLNPVLNNVLSLTYYIYFEEYLNLTI